MGASTKILIGVEVSYEDFVREQIEDVGGCSNGHKGESGKFCSQCGGTIGPIFKHLATERLKKFCEIINFPEEELLSCNSLGEIVGELYEYDPAIFIASVDHSGDGDPTCFVLGISTLETDSNDHLVDDTKSVSIPEFLDEIKEGKKFVEECGFDASKTRIYMTKCLTY